eukprot:CAMPEP_0185690446 /NCGR_PEP_ID=MMETSP1164-20130828/1124_1 /TAXON_ID=1104430 /ORGANISM="Chrysoreinhardia sp, Strain CCMP2950" /LENGTH=472 /DNA_ID=CAMNT_0028357013 /DNA_START=15 /DNA_END=1432 /DNA_ORIENTATION=-
MATYYCVIAEATAQRSPFARAPNALRRLAHVLVGCVYHRCWEVAPRAGERRRGGDEDGDEPLSGPEDLCLAPTHPALAPKRARSATAMPRGDLSRRCSCAQKQRGRVVLLCGLVARCGVRGGGLAASPWWWTRSSVSPKEGRPAVVCAAGRGRRSARSPSHPSSRPALLLVLAAGRPSGASWSLSLKKEKRGAVVAVVAVAVVVAAECGAVVHTNHRECWKGKEMASSDDEAARLKRAETARGFKRRALRRSRRLTWAAAVELAPHRPSVDVEVVELVDGVRRLVDSREADDAVPLGLAGVVGDQLGIRRAGLRKDGLEVALRRREGQVAAEDAFAGRDFNVVAARSAATAATPHVAVLAAAAAPGAAAERPVLGRRVDAHDEPPSLHLDVVQHRDGVLRRGRVGEGREREALGLAVVVALDLARGDAAGLAQVLFELLARDAPAEVADEELGRRRALGFGEAEAAELVGGR